MTGEAESSHGRPAARVWLIVGVALALGATAALVLTEDLRWLRLAILAALWAALIAGFVAMRYRRQAATTEQTAAKAQEIYELELEREIAARREFELEVESESRGGADNSREELNALREEVLALRQNLQALFGGEVMWERVALTAQAARLRGVREDGPRMIGAGGRGGRPPAQLTNGDPRQQWFGKAGRPGYPPPGRTPRRPAETPAERSVERSVERSAERSAERSMEPAIERPVDRTMAPPPGRLPRRPPPEVPVERSMDRFGENPNNPLPPHQPGRSMHRTEPLPRRAPAVAEQIAPQPGAPYGNHRRRSDDRPVGPPPMAPNGASGHTGGHRRVPEPTPAESTGSHAEGTSVSELLAAHGASGATPRRRRRADD